MSANIDTDKNEFEKMKSEGWREDGEGDTAKEFDEVRLFDVVKVEFAVFCGGDEAGCVFMDKKHGRE